MAAEILGNVVERCRAEEKAPLGRWPKIVTESVRGRITGAELDAAWPASSVPR